MFENPCFSGEITNFYALKTGRTKNTKKKIVVASQKKLILFIARVLQNHPSTGRLTFDNGKVFNLRDQTLENEKVSLFLWTEDLQRQFFRQSAREQIEQWMEGAGPEDVVALAGCISFVGGFPQFNPHPVYASYAKQYIKKRLLELDLVHLRQVKGALFIGFEQVAA